MDVKQHSISAGVAEEDPPPPRKKVRKKKVDCRYCNTTAVYKRNNAYRLKEMLAAAASAVSAGGGGAGCGVVRVDDAGTGSCCGDLVRQCPVVC